MNKYLLLFSLLTLLFSCTSESEFQHNYNLEKADPMEILLADEDFANLNLNIPNEVTEQILEYNQVDDKTIYALEFSEEKNIEQTIYFNIQNTNSLRAIILKEQTIEGTEDIQFVFSTLKNTKLAELLLKKDVDGYVPIIIGDDNCYINCMRAYIQQCISEGIITSLGCLAIGNFITASCILQCGI